MNGNARLGFGADGSVHVIYHKYDADGLFEMWAARPGGVESIGEPGSSWEIRRLTEWERRWDFGGHGTLDFEVEVFGSEAQPDGLDVVRGDFPGLQVNMLHGRGVGSGGGRYLLRWESLPENRGRLYAGHPQGGPLEVVRLPERQAGPTG